MKEWNIVFFNPDAGLPDGNDVFGIASDGFCPAGEEGKGYAAFPLPVWGEVLSGAYDEVLEQVQSVSQKERVKNALVFLKTLIGADGFLARLAELLPGAAFAGGAAARTEAIPPRIVPDGRDAAVMLVMQDSVVRAANLHDCEAQVELTREGRNVLRIDGVAAEEWYRQMAERYSQGKVDLEQVTLSDGNGKNVHFSPGAAALYANAAFETGDSAQLRVLKREDAKSRMERFSSEENAIVFGCAGLKGLTDGELAMGRGSTAGFLFGEVVTLKKPALANLMMAKIVFAAKKNGRKRRLSASSGGT